MVRCGFMDRPKKAVEVCWGKPGMCDHISALLLLLEKYQVSVGVLVL